MKNTRRDDSGKLKNLKKQKSQISIKKFGIFLIQQLTLNYPFTS